MSNCINLIGQKFGKLIVIKRAEKNIRSFAAWVCKCECGGEVIVPTNNLRSGNTKSCGCHRRISAQKSFTKHKKCDARLYVVWRDMKRRCVNPNAKDFQRYGARGITFCKEWKEFVNFEKWAMASGYNPNAKKGECTLERINNNGNYEPQNCKWTSLKEQCRNRKSNHFITINDETHCIAEWSEIYNIAPYVIQNRIKRGWDEKKAVTHPLKTKKGAN